MSVELELESESLLFYVFWYVIAYWEIPMGENNGKKNTTPSHGTSSQRHSLPAQKKNPPNLHLLGLFPLSLPLLAPLPRSPSPASLSRFGLSPAPPWLVPPLPFSSPTTKKKDPTR